VPGRARNVGCVLVAISALIAASCAGERERIIDAGGAQDSSVTPESSDAMPAASCSVESDAYPAGTTSDAIMHDGSMRTFRIHVPPSYDGNAPAPLVLMLHGGGGSGRQFQEASAGMDPIADREGFITLYPDGSGVLRTWNGGGCCGYAVTNDVDDVGFIAALLDHVEAALCIDRRRVFATGMSNGGIMSHRLACELADRIAAIAPVAGTDMTASCNPLRRVSVMQLHGSDDGHVPWDGGEGCGPAGGAFTSVPDTMERWRTRNACGAAVSPYFEQGDGSCEAFEGCEDGADVVLCSIEGGGHNWPGGAPPAGLVECPGNGGQSQTFLASEAAWSFFAAHPMATAAEGW
jgi:polyhydroxybutyrate depolymerase